MAENDKLLLRRYHEEGDLQAREQLIEQYMSLVRSLARRYSYRGEQLDDLVQIGSIGLIKAIDRFDLKRGVELTTYATPNIIGEIKRHFRDRSCTPMCEGLTNADHGIVDDVGPPLGDEIAAWLAEHAR